MIFSDPPLLLVSTTFLCLFYSDSRSLGEDGYDVDVPFVTEYHWVTHSPHFEQLWVSTLRGIYSTNKFLWWGLRNEGNFDYRDLKLEEIRDGMFISQNSSNRVPLQSVSPPTTLDTWPHLKEQISFCDGSLKCDQKSISGLHYICASIGAKDTYHTSHFCSLQSSKQGKTVHHSPPSSPNNTLCC